MSASETTPRQALDFMQDELNTAALYDALAGMESDARLAEVYHRLAASERRHAEHWRAKLLAGGVKLAAFTPSWRARVLMALGRRFGAGMILSIVANQEQAHAQKYSGVPDRAAGMD